MAFQPAGFDHPPRTELVLGVLEDAAEGALVRRLRLFANRLHPRDGLADLLGSPRLEPELDRRDHLARLERRVAVREIELLVRAPRRPGGVDDERPDENLLPVAAVGARVHPHAAPGGAGNRTRELEPAEAGVPRAVETDCVRRPPARHEDAVTDLDRRETVFEPDDQRLDALVGGEQVRAEADRAHRKLLLGRPGERFLQLRERPRPCERPRRPADPDSRQPLEPDAFLDLHASAHSGLSRRGCSWEGPTSPSHGASLTVKSARMGNGSAPKAQRVSPPVTRAPRG